MPSATPPKSDKVKKRPKVRGNYIRDPYLLSQWGLTELSGCYQCSRRRIDCDRTEPTCGKCSAKGIKCSGLGLRYRFNDGIAARGKFVGKSLPIIDGVEANTAETASASVSSCKRQNDPFRASGYETVEQYPVEIDNTTEEEHGIQDLVVSSHVPISIDWGLDHVDPKSRFCLGYCKSLFTILDTI